ncbi:MAG: hypothetical protein SNJ56_00790 [Termitinemataceae bacterium]
MTKNNNKKTTKKDSSSRSHANNDALGCLFGILIIIVFIGLFLLNKELIIKTLANPQKKLQDLFEQPSSTLKQPVPDKQESPQHTPPAAQPAPAPEKPSQKEVQPQNTIETKPSSTEPSSTQPPATQPSPTPPSTPQPRSPATGTQKPTTTTASESQNNVTTPPQQKPLADSKAPPQKTPATRDRYLYFIKVAEDGSLIRTRVLRSIPVSDKPVAFAMSLKVGVCAGDISEI